MTYPQVRVIATFMLLLGGALLIYLLWRVPPRALDGQLDGLAVLAFFLGLILATTGASSLAAAALHRHWPLLGGLRRNQTGNTPQRGQIALRQGLLLALAICAIAAFAFFRILDTLFVVVAFVIIIIVEAFLQTIER